MIGPAATGSGETSFVSFQEKGTQAEPKKSTPPKTDPTTTDAGNKDAGGKDAGEKKAGEKKAGEKKAGEEKAGEKDAGEEKAGNEDGGGAEPETKAAEKEAEIKPLDDALRIEIRDKITKQQAREPAQEKLEAAMESVRTAVNQFGRQQLRSEVLETVKAPDPLDFEKLASEHGLTYQKTPSLDALEMSLIQLREPADDDPPYYAIARAQETIFEQQGGMSRRTILDAGYQGDLDRFTPRRLIDGLTATQSFSIPPDAVFIFWRAEQTDETIPELEEVRSEVVAAWKLQQAFPLAEVRAEQLIKQAEKQKDKSLKEIFSDEADAVIETASFSWMTRGSLPTGSGGRPTLSPVRGTAGEQPVTLEGAGEEFMRSVFKLQVGQVGTAADEPHKHVYVVRIKEESPPLEQRKNLFFVSGVNQDLNTLIQTRQARLIRDWMDRLDEEFHLTWKDDHPRSDWNGS